MEQFEQNLINQLNQIQQRKPETVTLDRLIKFYEYCESQNWSCSICYYRNAMQAWINTHGKGVYEGHGETISDALDDCLNDLQKRGGNR